MTSCEMRIVGSLGYPLVQAVGNLFRRPTLGVQQQQYRSSCPLRSVVDTSTVQAIRTAIGGVHKLAASRRPGEIVQTLDGILSGLDTGVTMKMRRNQLGGFLLTAIYI